MAAKLTLQSGIDFMLENLKKEQGWAADVHVTGIGDMQQRADGYTVFEVFLSNGETFQFGYRRPNTQ